MSSTQESFFTAMLSGRIPTCRDETGALFIDRDPKLFSIILHFLRTKELDLNGVDVSVLRHEAEFYGILPLVKRLMLCEDLDRSLCGDVLFTGFIPTPQIPASAASSSGTTSNTSSKTSNQSNDFVNKINNNMSSQTGTSKPGNVLRLSNSSIPAMTNSTSSKANNGASLSQSSQLTNECSKSTIMSHSRNSSVDFVNANNLKKSHSRKSSYECSSTNLYHMHTSMSGGCGGYGAGARVNQQLELKQAKTDLGILLSENTTDRPCLKENNCQVNLIVGNHNWISVAYPHFVCVYKLKDGLGWQLVS